MVELSPLSTVFMKLFGTLPDTINDLVLMWKGREHKQIDVLLNLDTM